MQRAISDSARQAREEGEKLGASEAAAVQAAALEARGNVGVDIEVVEPVVRAAELLDDGEEREWEHVEEERLGRRVDVEPLRAHRQVRVALRRRQLDRAVERHLRLLEPPTRLEQIAEVDVGEVGVRRHACAVAHRLRRRRLRRPHARQARARTAP